MGKEEQEPELGSPRVQACRKGGPGRPRAPESLGSSGGKLGIGGLIVFQRLGDHAHVSSGATALASLRNHLEGVVEHLEAFAACRCRLSSAVGVTSARGDGRATADRDSSLAEKIRHVS